MKNLIARKIPFLIFTSLTFPAFSSLSLASIVLNNNTHTVNVIDPLEVTLADDVSGNGTLEKIGNGTLILTGNNSYSGSTHLVQGVLGLTSNNSLGTSSLLIDQGAVLRTNGTLSIGNSINGARSVTFDTRGDLTVTGSARLLGFTLTGGGKLKFENLSNVFDPILIEQGILEMGVGRFQQNIENRGYLILNQNFDGSMEGDISAQGSLTKIGSGTLRLTGTNSYRGGTYIGGGLVAINGDQNLGVSFREVTLDGGGLKALNSLSIGREIVLGNGGGIIDTNGFDSTFSGRIQGTGSLTKEGLGTLFISGMNDYAGGTIINNGILQVENHVNPAGFSSPLTINNGAVLKVSAPMYFWQKFNLGMGGGVIDTDGFDSTIYGDFNGSGGLTKRGNGSLMLAGFNNNYAGPTEVKAGTLLLGSQHALGFSDLTVMGTLDMNQYSAQVKDVLNKGTINLRTGTLHTNHFTTQGEVVTELASASEYGKIRANDFVLLDGTVLRVLLKNGYRPNASTVFRVIEGASITETFSFLIQPAALSFEAIYGPTFVDIRATEVPFGQTALNGNQSGIANALDQIRTQNSSLLTNEISTLNTLNADELRSAFQQMGPITLASLSGMGFAGINSQSAALRRRFEGLRSGNNDGHFALYDTRSKNPVLAVVADAGADLNGISRYKTSTNTNKWGFFGSLNGSFGRLGEMSGDDGVQPGYDFSSNGFTLGIDRRVTNNTTVGASVGYQTGKSDLDFAQGSSEVTSINSDVYASHSFGNGVFGNSAIGVSKDSYEIKRGIPLFGRTATGSPGGMGFNGLLEVGVDRRIGKMKASPSLSAEYSHLSVDAYSESGADGLNLNIKDQTAESLRTVLGSRLSRDFNRGKTTWTPSARLGWQHEFKDESRPIEAQFAAGGDAFTVKTAEAGKDSALLGAGLAAKFTENVTGFVEYKTELGRDNFNAQTVSGNLRVAF